MDSVEAVVGMEDISGQDVAEIRSGSLDWLSTGRWHATHHLLSDDSGTMQGALCMPPRQLGLSTTPEKINDSAMDVTTSPSTTKETNNQSDSSGIFSATSNTTIPEEAHKSDNERSECDSPERKYVCPICEDILTSPHDFTVHIRTHNNVTGGEETEKLGFTCRICLKVLSSSSSLDRHVLVHSGERPFTCKYCGDTFTTNGNMHRHMRTHKDNYESDGSTDSQGSSGGKSIEFNNNKVEKYEGKRKLDDSVYKHPRKKLHLDDEPFNNKCPVCERDDFTSLKSLEMHLEDNHPDYPAKCHQCDKTFKNNKILNFHRNTVHADEKGKTLEGFKDLTFIDFSSDKFPHIARYECEKNLHKPTTTTPKYQCSKCQRAFPCEKSLSIHQESCPTLDLSTTDNPPSENEIRRSDFFSRLDLQDNSPEKSPVHNKKFWDPNIKDLADIQSIISMTSNGALLQHLQQQQQQQTSKVAEPLVQLGHNEEKTEEEESQDIFAQEFRKMKLRGEFPCRLCTAIFPNLRALKGHNRTHLNSTHNGNYRCNMCPHSSIDKAALIRHMRTHNGDRPYECSLCNYAFTTKANCERHLRNRHSKTTREEVKKSIIYHPSEDPTNEDISRSLETAKKLNSSVESGGDLTPDKLRSSTPKSGDGAKGFGGFPPYPAEMNNFNELIPKLQALKELKSHQPFVGKFSEPYLQPPPSTFLTSTPQKTSAAKIQVKSLSTLKQIPIESYETDNNEDSNEPMNLVLDLSKKKSSESTDIKKEEPPAEDLTKKNGEHTLTNILAQQLLSTAPKIEPSSLYSSMYRFPNFPTFPINPMLFPMQNTLLQDSQEMKERLQRLQLCGGGMIMDLAERLKTFYQPQNLFAAKPPENYTPKPVEEMKPLSLNIDTHNSYAEKMKSPVVQPKADLMQSPNSVKMVIKNGVLMPKQKQRRYRTERPFSCEHCSARFTLRSNMERHIKQQHPQYWSQRQRSSVGNPGRKPQLLPPTIKCDLNIPSYEPPKETNQNQISDKLKYAILTQHLRAAKESHDQADEDCELVIDEPQTPPPPPAAQSKSRILEDKLRELHERQLQQELKLQQEMKLQQQQQQHQKGEEGDLVPVSRLLDNASQQQFKQYFRRDASEEVDGEGISEEDEEGLVASGSTSEGNSGTDENKSESDTATNQPIKKKSAYSLAPNRVSCPYCSRKFPWTSSLRRHILTHTGQKPFKCSHCPLLFTTKSNCDRHLLRKHGSSATTISNETPNNSSNSFLMRNVPERPFKCSSCPSSTFSTYSNLKKHVSHKHAGDDRQGYEAGSSEDEKVGGCDGGVAKGEWEAQIKLGAEFAASKEVQNSNSDLPFKCHLCDYSCAERQECLDHIRDRHCSEYDLLMSKNALDANASTPDDSGAHDDDADGDMRGKFPDYSNRKVICAFCMRRFWSAEDLRRHMRTHTGERPFSCDICRRRFTLKHSMLRHRKKHNNVTFENDNVSDDENVREAFEKKMTTTDDSDGNEGGGDLISNLLGIRDRSIIEQALTASANDAAKILGVNGQE